MTEESDKAAAAIIAAFDAIPDDSPTQVALTKKDLEHLLNSISKLHESYARLLDWPIVVSGMKPEEEKQTRDLAKESYEEFAQFADGLIGRFVRESQSE